MFIARMFLGDTNKGCKIVKIRKSYNFNPSIVIFKTKKNYSVQMTVLRWISINGLQVLLSQKFPRQCFSREITVWNKIVNLKKETARSFNESPIQMEL
jgi:hypothetical protein